MKTPRSVVCLLSIALAWASAFADAPALPESLKKGLALWLSAEKNVFEGTFNGKGGVIHWCDVRGLTITIR